MIKDITILQALVLKYGDEATIKQAIAFERLYFQMQCYEEKVESERRYLHLNDFEVPDTLMDKIHLISRVLGEIKENPCFEVLDMSPEEVVEFYKDLTDNFSREYTQSRKEFCKTLWEMCC